MVYPALFGNILIKKGLMAMADYKRLISYLYNYEYNSKKNNVGYVRVESRNGQCKITAHINVLTMNEAVLKVCFFLREREQIKCVVLGTMSPHNGTGEFQTVTKTEDLGGSGFSLEDMSGMILYASADKFFGTEWDDRPIVMAEFAEAEKESVKVAAAELALESPVVKEEENTEVIRNLKNEETGVREEKPPEDHLNHKSLEEQLKEALAEVMEKSHVKVPDKEPEKTTEKEPEKAPEKVPEAETGKSRFGRYGTRNFIKNFKGYPRIEAFEDDEILECVRIEPQDIGLLPIECWDLANNSFLLHGYYSYRHLVFAKMKWGEGIKNAVGVPGIFYNREKFMASMFGFEQFKSIKITEQKTGEFGYWFRPVP